ncbi:MAG: beta-N-acetylhexosaminidase [Defluviitaleaceae bacterium]|nr:beta-N-acetylhexosaminidase [Defluviitaleaceae bacterium]
MKRRKFSILYIVPLAVIITLLVITGLNIRAVLISPFIGAAADGEPIAAAPPEITGELPSLTEPPTPVPSAPAAPSPTPVPEPEPEEIDPVQEKIMEIIAAMTLHERLCQMLVVVPDSITGVARTNVAGQTTREALERYPVGGLILFEPNISREEQIVTFTSTLQTYSEIPMFIAVDEEGGRVSRLQRRLRAHSVRAMLTYEDDGEETAFDNAVTLSNALTERGFNTNFAPVADVWSNPANRVIGDRAFSTDFDTAATLVAAAVRGFNASNIICSVKHFPGHGNTREDSHYATAYVNRTLDELRENEFKPFAAGIEAGADMVMTGHLIVPGVDELPATLSKTLLTDILRGELGFDGVIITDALNMNAISSAFSEEFVAVTAIKAGVDILLMPVDVERTIAALTAAVESGEISESRIDESVGRIIELKIARGIIEF